MNETPFHSAPESSITCSFPFSGRWMVHTVLQDIPHLSCWHSKLMLQHFFGIAIANDIGKKAPLYFMKVSVFPKSPLQTINMLHFNTEVVLHRNIFPLERQLKHIVPVLKQTFLSVLQKLIHGSHSCTGQLIVLQPCTWQFCCYFP